MIVDASRAPVTDGRAPASAPRAEYDAGISDAQIAALEK